MFDRCAAFAPTVVLVGGPLVAGVATFAVWSVTQWDLLSLAGAAILGFGALAFRTGLIEYRNDAREFGTEGALAKTALASLLLCWPAALASLYGASYLGSTYRVQIHNDTPVALTHLRVITPGSTVELGALEPGGTIARRVSIEGGEGQLVCTVRTASGDERDVELDEYVESGYSGDVTLRVRNEGPDVVEHGYR